MNTTFSTRFFACSSLDERYPVLQENPVTNQTEISLASQKPGENHKAFIREKVTILFQHIAKQGWSHYLTFRLENRKVYPLHFIYHLRLLRAFLRDHGKEEIEERPAKRIRRDDLENANPINHQDFLTEETLQNIYRAWPLTNKRVLVRQDYVDSMPPDITFKIGKRENQKEFKAHSSLLRCYPYWQTLLSAEMKEGQTVKAGQHLTIEETEIPDDEPAYFEMLLDFLYMGYCEWQQNPLENTLDLTKQMVIYENLKILANKYNLLSFETFCKLQLKRLCLIYGQQARANIKEISIPFAPFYLPPFTKEQVFTDFTLKIGTTAFRVNRLLLMARDLLFKELLLKYPTSVSEITLPESLPLEFLKQRIGLIYEGKLSTLQKQLPLLPPLFEVEEKLRGDRLAKILQLQTLKTQVITEDNRSLHRRGFILDRTTLIEKEEFLAQLDLVTYLQVKMTFESVFKNESSFTQYMQDLLKAVGSQLEYLDLSNLSQWVDLEFIKLIALHCPNLQILQFNPYTTSYEEDQEIKKWFPRLQNLNGKLCNEIDADIMSLNDKTPKEEIFSQLNLMTHLQVEGTFKRLFTDKDSFTQYMQNLLNTVGFQLEYLDLSSIQWMDEEIIKISASYCPQLQHLNLANSKIRDNDLIIIAQGFPELQSLDLSECENITDKGIESIAQGCPLLRDLKFRNLDITNHAIRALAENCSQLTNLDLYECTRITDGALNALIEACPKLINLELGGCSSTKNYVHEIFNFALRGIIVHFDPG